MGTAVDLDSLPPEVREILLDFLLNFLTSDAERRFEFLKELLLSASTASGQRDAGLIWS